MSQSSLKPRPITIYDPSEYLCGIGSWTPQWIQRFATPKVFLIIFSTVGVLQGAVFTYTIASMTTIEKRYAFASIITGLILIADNISEMIFSPWIGFLANRLHRPRVIAFGEMITVIGCFIAAAPYFIYGPAVHLLGHTMNNRTYEFCDSNRNIDANCEENATIVPAVVLLWFASCCNGLGFAVFYVVGLPFIDDSVKKKNSPLYLSIIAALRLCGPTLGFLLSSFCLQFYENPFYNHGIHDRKDPRWVGAWWLGFVILGVLIFMSTLPLLIFPRKLKTSKSLRPEIYKPETDTAKHNKLWPSIKRLSTNWLYVCHTLGTVFRLFGVLGFMTFKGKYIESQYRTSASSANFFSGAAGVIPMVIGIISGGVFIRQLKPKAKLLVTLMTIVEFIGSLAYFAGMFLGCDPPTIAGLTTNGIFSIKDTCNTNCACSTHVFNPICVRDVTYFSPCTAGCKSGSLSTHKDYDVFTDRFTNCECINEFATPGYCPNNCNTFPIYITLLGLGNIIASLARTGNTILNFRIVDKKDKSFAMGFGAFFMCIFTFIPYPLTFGAISDSACLVWENWCGKSGNCWIYDTEKFRYYLHGSAFLFISIGSLFDILLIILSGRIKNLYDDDDIENNEINKEHEEIAMLNR